jgi:hypothetical protein
MGVAIRRLGRQFRELRDGLVDAFLDPSRLNQLLPTESGSSAVRQGVIVGSLPV